MPLPLPDPHCEFPISGTPKNHHSPKFCSDWQARQQPDGKFLYYCIICRDGRERPLNHVARHEGTATHKEAVRAFHAHAESTSTPTQSNTHDGSSAVLRDDAVRHLLSSLTSNPGQHPPYPLPATQSQSRYAEPNFPNSHQAGLQLPSQTNINWFAYSAQEETVAESTPYDDVQDYIAQKALDMINGDIQSDADLNTDQFGVPTEDSAYSIYSHKCVID